MIVESKHQGRGSLSPRELIVTRSTSFCSAWLRRLGKQRRKGFPKETQTGTSGVVDSPAETAQDDMTTLTSLSSMLDLGSTEKTDKPSALSSHGRILQPTLADDDESSLTPSCRQQLN